MSSNIIELIAGPGISLEANATASTITMTNASPITDNQKAALNNDKASSTNKFITNSEMDDKIQAALAGNPPIPAPAGYPKFITSSSTFTIPKKGKYKFSLVGGGGGGSFGKAGLDGNSTVVVTPVKTLTANGGHGGQASTISGTPNTTTALGGKATIPYDGTKGATNGGDYKQSGQYGAYNGGVGTAVIGGGGGSPLNYNTPRMEAEKAKTNISSVAELNESPSPAVGYGAGGDGAHIYPDNIAGVGAGAGGSSGYLITEVLELENNANIDVTIGAGGAHVDNGDPSYHSGAGVNGAVLVEWVYQ